MAVKTDAQIKAQFEAIRDETAESGNTKDRVYNALKDSYDTVLDRMPAGPPTPSGVTWHEAPYLAIDGNTVTVSAGIANVNGSLVNIPEKSFTPSLPAAGFKQPYSAFSDYLASSPVHEIDGAAVVAETASYSWPTVPENRLWVANFMLTNSGITQVGTGAVKSVTLNGGPEQFPNPQGKLALQTFTPIAENEFGTHPAFASQHDINAYLLSGGTYTPPAVQPVTGASATPQSDTEILLTWTNPA